MLSAGTWHAAPAATASSPPGSEDPPPRVVCGAAPSPAALGVSSASFNACVGAGSTDFVGYRAAFGLLLAPCILAALLATRARAGSA